MSSEEIPASNEAPGWATARESDFNLTDVNAPLTNIQTVDGFAISRVYVVAAEAAMHAGQAPQERTYAMLGSLASMLFKPNEPQEPFGPMARFGDKRSAQPSDFIGPPVAVLAAQVARLDHPAIRTRVADVVWLLDRKQVAAGQTALEGYVEIVRGVRDGALSFRGNGFDTFETADHLRRAMQIGKGIGWDSSASLVARDLTAQLRATAAQDKRIGTFRRLATLDLDYAITDAIVVASEASELAAGVPDLHSRHALLHVAARANRRAGRQQEADARLLEAGECLVSIASGGDGSAMLEAHWLEKAIAELQQVPQTRERRRELKHQLVEAQSRIIDELTHFSHEQDISALVEAARAAVSGRPLMAAISAFVRLSRSPTPEQLQEEALAQIEANPLHAIFASTTYDSGGKAVHKDPGMEGSGINGGLQRQIHQGESIRRSLTAREIETARLAIVTEHYITEEVLGLICGNSPFVPGDRETIFVSGILNFFRRDMISALHTLVPQLENSLRHVLRMHGYDVTKLNEDMTQQDLTLSALLDRMRPELEKIFGAPVITDIDNLFNSTGGPNLRNRVAHGSIPDGLPFGNDSVYACWLILQICCIPILRSWERLSAIYDAHTAV